MRAGLLFSATFHGGLLAAMFIALPDTEPLQVAASRALPVELVTIDEFTSLRDIPRPEPSPEPPAEEIAEPEPEPEPIAEVPPEPLPEPEAAPIPEPEPAPAPEPEPSPEPALEPEPEPEPEPKPQPKPPTPRAEPKPAFDPTQIAALLDKLPEDQPREQQRQRPTELTVADRRIAISISDAFRKETENCWTSGLISGSRDADQIVVRVQVNLNINGQIVGEPRVLNRAPGGISANTFQAAKRSVIAALKKCSSENRYNLPPDRFELWRELTLTFSPIG